MNKPAVFILALIFLGGCASPQTPAKAIYAIARQDRYSGINASRTTFSMGETPCLKIAGYGSSTFSYRLYKEGLLESVDSGSVNKTGDNEVLTCWRNLPAGSYKFQIYDSSGGYVDTIEFRMGN